MMTMLLSQNCSNLGLRPNWPDSGYALSHAHYPSLELTTEDFLIIYDVHITNLLNGVNSAVIYSKETLIAPARGMRFEYNLGCLRLVMYDNAGGVIHRTVASYITEGHHIILVFADRDGSIAVYDNGTNVLQTPMGLTNIDQSCGASIQMFQNGDKTIRSQGCLGYQYYMFTAGQLPTGAERLQIVNEAMADTQTVPPTLSARSNYLAEQRLYIDFANIDPSFPVVPDQSAFMNWMDINTVSWDEIGKEYEAPPRIMSVDNGNQWGISKGFVDQQNLTGINVDANDFVIELLIKNHKQDQAFSQKVAASHPVYFTFGDNALASYISIFQQDPGSICVRGVGPPCYWPYNTSRIFQNELHIFLVVRAASYTMCMNGHVLNTSAKAAHNINSQRLSFFGTTTIGGVTTPGVGCLARIYIGDFSGMSDNDFLQIHQKWLSYPFEQIQELSPYLKFDWRGRQPNGAQIPGADTTIQNAVNSETLQIQNALSWQDIRERFA